MRKKKQNTKKKFKKRIKSSDNLNNLTEKNIDNVDPNKDKYLYYFFKEEDIYAKFFLKNKSKNYIYFSCSKYRVGCPGYIEYSKKDKKWLLINECISKINHDTIKYETFYKYFLDKDFHLFNMEYIKLQKYYVRCLFKTNEANDINNVKSIFKNKFNIFFKINKSRNIL